MLFINGDWKPGCGTEFHSENPATGISLWSGREATSTDVDEAVQAARAAVPEWHRCGLERRAEILNAFQHQLETHQTALARCISEETGKAQWDADSEVRAMIAKISVSLAALKERRSPARFTLGSATAATRYKPHGVLAVYGPFNFPGHIANGQIVPALAAGNTIVFKPSELTPCVAEETVKLWERAGLPPGVLNLVQGGRTTGEALVQHPDVNGILFTGSLRTAIALRRAVLEQPEKILALELGGNNPLVIHQPDDISAAVYWTIQSAFLSGGQRCTCARRLIVTDGNQNFLDRLVTVARQLRIDFPDADPQPFYGSLIHAGAVDAVMQEQSQLIQGGGTPLLQAAPLDQGPAFISPGIIDVTNCKQRRDEEIFGPLLQVIRVNSLEEAIHEANNTQYGLAAALFTRNRNDFDLFYEEVRAGLINWNRPTTGASGRLPFGGLGRSGNHRPAGYFAVDFCNVPIASLEADSLEQAAAPSPGVPLS